MMEANTHHMERYSTFSSTADQRVISAAHGRATFGIDLGNPQQR
jgi:hypothetical protein